MGASGELFMQIREEEAGLQHGVSFEHLLDAKKSNIAAAVETISTAVKDGNYDSLKGLILAVKGKAFFTDLEKSLRPLAEGDYLDRIEKNYSLHDTKVDQAATKTEYDYTACKDPVYDRLADEEKSAKENLKQRCDFLKGLKEKITVVDEETGEVNTIYPPNKLQSEGLKITIK